MLSIIIPANNEAAYIGACLDALLLQEGDLDAIEIIVVANACTDDTVPVSESYREKAEIRGWKLTVLDIPEGGKPNALNQGDAAASGDMRLYLDADVICSPPLISQLIEVLRRPRPIYASGKFLITPAKSWITQHYVNLWTRLPFMTTGVPGGGLFSVNAEARARWGKFPHIIADDTYVRLQFKPEERIGVPASYSTPLSEGWKALIRVRKRWDAGSREIEDKYPELLANDDKATMRPVDHLRLFLETPVSYLVYAAVKIAVRFGRNDGWVRGR